jgi:uncharacterized membrane protein
MPLCRMNIFYASVLQGQVVKVRQLRLIYSTVTQIFTFLLYVFKCVWFCNVVLFSVNGLVRFEDVTVMLLKIRSSEV